MMNGYALQRVEWRLQTKAKKMPNFLRGHVLFMKDCVTQHIHHARGSFDELSWIVVEIIRYVHNNIDDVVSSHCTPDESPLYGSCVNPFRDVLLLRYI